MVEDIIRWEGAEILGLRGRLVCGINLNRASLVREKSQKCPLLSRTRDEYPPAKEALPFYFQGQ